MSSDGLHICLVIVSAALLGAGWGGNLSCHKFYTRLLTRLVFAHWVVLVYMVYFSTLDICFQFIPGRVKSAQSLESSAPFFRVYRLLKALEFFVGGPKVVSEFF